MQNKSAVGHQGPDIENTIYHNDDRAMKPIRPHYLVILLIMIFLSSCAKPRTNPKIVSCPSYEQNCRPVHWKGLPYDTSEIARKYNDWYYVFEPVTGLNSPEDEWALTFIDSAARAILTCKRSGRQTSRFAEFSAYNKGRDISGVGEPMPGNCGAFAACGNKLMFSNSARDGMIGRSMLYSANLNGNRIESVKYAGASIHWDDMTWFSHPALSPDGSVLFFSADRPYGKGGADIWFSILQDDGLWGEPFNCGLMINSVCEELTPFVSRDGKTLYFASCGHNSIGGFDIFRSEISDRFWTDIKEHDPAKLIFNTDYFGQVKNMRPPLNTKADELFPSAPGDAEMDFYYCSNQSNLDSASPSTGFDIYVRHRIVKDKPKVDPHKKTDIDIAVIDEPEMDIPEPDVPEVEEEPEITEVPDEPKVIDIPQTFVLEGYIRQENDRTILPDSYIKAVSGESGKLITKTNADNSAKYRMELPKGQDLLITAFARERFHDTYELYVDANDTITTITHDFNLPVIFTLRINFPTDEYKTPYQYTLDSNGAETRVTWQNELDNIAQNIKKYKDYISKLEFVGHTDDIGTDAYNIALGRRRVNFIISQLIERGVPANMLVAKSRGERQMLPIRPGESEQLRRKRCRRVEMTKILKKEKK